MFNPPSSIKQGGLHEVLALSEAALCWSTGAALSSYLPSLSSSFSHWTSSSVICAQSEDSGYYKHTNDANKLRKKLKITHI